MSVIIRKNAGWRTDEKLNQRIAELAKKEKRSQGMQVEFIIEKFFEEYDKKK